MIKIDETISIFYGINKICLFTGLNPAGEQEITNPGDYLLNSGSTMKFSDSELRVQNNVVTNSIYVTVLPLEDP
ncbi:MAG: hypothetical protein ACFE94_05850 [Candidatus Hodarchaeota archaeon]